MQTGRDHADIFGLTGVGEDLFRETIDALFCEIAGGVFALRFEIPGEAGAGLVLLLEFFRLADGMDSVSVTDRPPRRRR